MATLRELQAQLFDKINPAVKFSVTRYVLAVGFFIAVFMFGVVSSMNLGVDLLPQVNIPVVVVNVSYTGASPSVMDQQVTQVVENTVSTLQGITDINSTSSSGSSRVVLSLTADTDKNAAANQVSARVAAVTKRLPTGVSAPTVQTFDPNSQPILQFGISGAGIPMTDVGNWVSNDLALQLERVDGVANVQVDGAPTRQFQVLLNPNQLASYKLNPQQVTNAIAADALTQPIGNITSNSNTVTFSTNNLPGTVADVSKILVDPVRGIAVGDVAIVRDFPLPTNYVRVNGVPAVLVSVQKTTDGNSVAVAKRVRDFLAKKALPPGYSLAFSNDTTGPITASVDSTWKELILTAIVVAIICLLFLGKLNTAVSVIFAIPIALSAAPVLYALAGFSFNLVSLLAMIVAIGIVVDDSIVVSENVERYRAMGYSLMESVLKGASEVFSAVVAASLSLLSVLLPVSFLGGFIGRYIMQFSLGLAAAVFFSLIEAVLFLTVRLAYTPDSKTLGWPEFVKGWGEFVPCLKWGLKNWYKGPYIVLALIVVVFVLFTKLWVLLALVLMWPLTIGVSSYVLRIFIAGLQALTTLLHNLTEAGLEWVRDRYVRSLDAVLRQGKWILIGAAVFFVATLVFIGPKIPFNFVPSSDNGVLQVTVRAPQSTPPSVINALAGKIENWLLTQPEVATTQDVVTTGFASGNGGFAQIVIQLVPIEKRRGAAILAQAYRKVLLPMAQRDLPTARLGVGTGGFGGGQGSTVSFVLSSSDMNQLTATNDKVIAALNANPLVTDVNSSMSNTTLENDFVPDPDRLQGTGLNTSTVATALQTYASGVQAGNVEIGGLAYPIEVQLDPAYLTGTQSLLNLPVYSSTLGTNLSAGQLGRFNLAPAPTQVTRYNRVYSATLDINLKPNSPPPLAFQNMVTAELTKDGILNGQVTFGAESRNGPAALAGQLATQGPIAFLLALFLAYLVMGAQFNSWRYPLYLLLPVPLALVGALWLVFAEGGGLDIFGLLGMLMLIGLSAKNAIIYLDFVVERLHAHAMPLREALIDSARLRFRPIVMTTLTVLVISFPLIFNGGQGSEFGQKMGLVMLGGVFTSAILTFFVVPAAFWLFERRRNQEEALGIAGPGSVGVLGSSEVAASEGQTGVTEA